MWILILKNDKPNLTHSDTECLKALRRHPDIVFSWADKGDQIVVMDKREYISKRSPTLVQLLIKFRGILSLVFHISNAIIFLPSKIHMILSIDLNPTNVLMMRLCLPMSPLREHWIVSNVDCLSSISHVLRLMSSFLRHVRVMFKILLYLMANSLMSGVWQRVIPSALFLKTHICSTSNWNCLTFLNYYFM